MSIKRFFPDTRPTLDLNFAATKRLDPRITYTRASTGTFVGSNGLIQSAAVNQARFEHNPLTGESLGLLVEEARTNLFMNSIDFLEPGPNADHRWSKYGTSIVANTAIAPDGTLTASKIVATATTEQHRIGRPKGLVSPAWSSIFLKAAEYTICDLYDLNIDTGFRIDLTTGALSESPAFVGKFRADQYGVNAIGNGWYRVLIGRSFSDGTVNNQLSVYPNGAQNYTGDGTSGILAWGAQLEAGAFVTSYIPTPSATVTRSADVASVATGNFDAFNSTFLFTGVRARYVGGQPRLAQFVGSNGENRLFAQNDWYTSGPGGGHSGPALSVDSNFARSNYALGFNYNGTTTIKASSQNGSATAQLSASGQVIPNNPVLTFGAEAPVTKTIQGITCWPTLLSGSVLQAITR